MALGKKVGKKFLIKQKPAFFVFADPLLCQLQIGAHSLLETGQAHWEAAYQRPGQRIFMWHLLK